MRQSNSIIQQIFEKKLRRNISSGNYYDNYNNNSYYDNNNYDFEKLREEILRVKGEYNKKCKELHSIKIAYNKLENDYKNNLNMIERLLDEADKNMLEKIESAEDFENYNNNNINNNISNNNFNNNNDINENMKNQNLYINNNNNNLYITQQQSDNNINNLNNNIIEEYNNSDNNNNINENNYNYNINSNSSEKEKLRYEIRKIKENVRKTSMDKIKSSYFHQRMKIEILELRSIIKKKDEEIQKLNNNKKILIYKDLDEKYAKTYQELIEISEKYLQAQQIQNEYLELKEIFRCLSVQLDFYKKQFKQIVYNNNINNNEFNKLNTNSSANNIKVRSNSSTSILNNKKNLNIVEMYKLQLDNRNKIIEDLNMKLMICQNENENKKNANNFNDSLKKEKEKNRKLNYEIEKLKKKNFELENNNMKYFEQIEKLKNAKINKENNKNVIHKLEKEIIQLKNEIIGVKMKNFELLKENEKLKKNVKTL